MSRGVPLGILLALVTAAAAGGYTFLDLGVGGRVYPGSARGSGMAETGWLSEENSFATMLNPATLAMIAGPDVTVAYHVQETRSFPAYDSFDALLGYNTYAVNKNYYQNAAVGFATGVVPRALGLSFGVMYSPVYDFNYDYEEEIRDRSTSSQPQDELIARAYILGEGTLKAISFGVARLLAEEASVGVSLDYVFGGYDLTARVDWADGSPGTEDAISASNLDGVRLRVAGRIEAGRRWEVGFEATTRCNMRGDFSATTANDLLWFLPLPETGDTTLAWKDVEVSYPASFGIGVRFHPRNELVGLFEIGMKYVGWSAYGGDFYGDFALDNVMSWHAGVEHVFYSGMPLRFGLAYSPSPKDKDIREVAFTFGSGFATHGWTVDFSGRIGWNDYRYPDIFDDEMFGAPHSGDGLRWRDEVAETSFSGRLSFMRRF